MEDRGWVYSITPPEDISTYRLSRPLRVRRTQENQNQSLLQNNINSLILNKLHLPVLPPPVPPADETVGMLNIFNPELRNHPRVYLRCWEQGPGAWIYKLSVYHEIISPMFRYIGESTLFYQYTYIINKDWSHYNPLSSIMSVLRGGFQIKRSWNGQNLANITRNKTEKVYRVSKNKSDQFPGCLKYGKCGSHFTVHFHCWMPLRVQKFC